jgi:chloramphenicol-sensitive protein RarD
VPAAAGRQVLNTADTARRGVVYAALAYTIWGLFPLYFRLLASVSAVEVLVHRVVWSLLFMLVVLGVRRQWGWLADALRNPRVLGAFAASALLLSGNWLTYIWAVQHDHVIDASLGYFITPLVNVLLGTTVLGERPRPAQWVALALAAIGVLWLTLQAGQPPWIALVLAASFGSYGLLRWKGWHSKPCCWPRRPWPCLHGASARAARAFRPRTRPPACC